MIQPALRYAMPKALIGQGTFIKVWHTMMQHLVRLALNLKFQFSRVIIAPFQAGPGADNANTLAVH